MALTMTDAPQNLQATPEFIISNINAIEPAKLLRIPISFGSYITLGLLDTGRELLHPPSSGGGGKHPNAKKISRSFEHQRGEFGRRDLPHRGC